MAQRGIINAHALIEEIEVKDRAKLVKTYRSNAETGETAMKTRETVLQMEPSSNPITKQIHAKSWVQ